MKDLAILLPDCFEFGDYVKVSRSQNEIVRPKLLPKSEQTNLFFYPDSPDLLNLKSKFLDRQDRKTNLFVYFLGEVTGR